MVRSFKDFFFAIDLQVINISLQTSGITNHLFHPNFLTLRVSFKFDCFKREVQ